MHPFILLSALAVVALFAVATRTPTSYEPGKVPKHKRGRRRPYRWLLGLGIFGALVIAIAIRAWPRASVKPPRSEAVSRGTVEIKVTETGTIQPLKTVEVKSKVAGRVSVLAVQEGDRVRAGQVVAEIEPTEINSEVAQIQAQLDGANARYQRALRNVSYQAAQTDSSIRQARDGLESAQDQLRIAQEQNQMQPGLSASAVADAQAGLTSAQDQLQLMQQSTHPQAVVQAQSAYDDALAGAKNSRLNLQRQQQLLSQGYVAQQVVDQAQADLATANAKLDQAKKRLDLIDDQNRLELADAESRVAQAKATLTTARTNQAQDAIKVEGVKSARAAVAQAQATLEAALSNKQQNLMRGDEVSDARATVVQLQHQLQEQQVHQHDTRLFATLSGIVTQRYIEQGELVTSGVSTFSSGTPVLEIADTSKMLVKLAVNEVDVHKLHPGLPVEITVDGAPGRTFQGRVRRVAPAAIGMGAANSGNSGASSQGNSVVRYAVEVLIERPDPRMKPGMSARCNIIVARRSNVLRLPQECIRGGGSHTTVQLIHPTPPGSKPDIRTQPITVGLRGDDFVEIRQGLSLGQRVEPNPYTGPKRQSLDLH